MVTNIPVMTKTVVIKIMNKNSIFTSKSPKRQTFGKNYATAGQEKFVRFFYPPFILLLYLFLVVIVVIVVNVLVLYEFLVTGKKQVNT